jgi:hypothetical protein
VTLGPTARVSFVIDRDRVVSSAAKHTTAVTSDKMFGDEKTKGKD